MNVHTSAHDSFKSRQRLYVFNVFGFRCVFPRRPSEEFDYNITLMEITLTLTLRLSGSQDQVSGLEQPCNLTLIEEEEETSHGCRCM